MAHVLELSLVERLTNAPVLGAEVKVEQPGLTISAVSDGRGIVRLELPEALRHLGIRVRKETFVPKLIAWDLYLCSDGLPDKFTLRMEKGIRIGGIVRNQAGEPAEGANVLLTLRGSSSDGEQSRVYDDIWEHRVPTDKEGRWQFDEAPPAVDPMHVRLEHPEYISNEYIQSLPPKEDFRNGIAVLTLFKGVPCEGTVTDEQGKPIEGVDVICGEDGADSTSTPTRRTDERGYFRFGGISLKHRGESAILSFLKKGYAPELIELQPSSVAIQKNVTLRPGKLLRVRFTNKEGEPIPGVTLAVNSWRERRPFHLGFESNETGVAQWENAPDGPVGYATLHKDYQYQDVLLAAADGVQTVVLPRPVKMSGRVVDAQTRQPIPEFSLVQGSHYPGSNRPAWSHWNTSYVYKFTAGEYRTSSQRPVRTMSRSGGPGEEGFHRLRIEAPGYKPAISRPIANDEEIVECDFELERGEAIEGLVRDPLGNPLSNAELVIAGAGNPVMVHNGKIAHRGYTTISTDEQGRYLLPPQEEDFQAVIAHPEAGYLLTSCEELRASPDVRLLAWGRLELITTAGQDTKPDYYLHPVIDRSRLPERVRFNSSPVLAGDGTFVFEGLTSGEMQLGKYGAPMRYGTPILVENGKTTRMDLRSGRRTIVGRILLPPEGVSTEPPLAHLNLRKRMPSPPIPEGMDAGQLKAWRLSWHKTPEGRAYLSEVVEVPFEIDPDGRFRIHDIAPGPYKLSALFLRSTPSGSVVKPDVAGLAVKDFDLPAGEDNFSLGDIHLDPPDDFQFQSTRNVNPER